MIRPPGARAGWRIAVVALALSAPPTHAQGGVDTLHVLMIGNSLTSTEGIPDLIATMAERAGEVRPRMTVRAFPDFSLADHWQDGRARAALRASRPDVVVLQQGPSTLPASGRDLRMWVARWAEAARVGGGHPVLYAVWAPEGADLDAGIRHHAEAATATNAGLYPVSTAWRLAWTEQPRPALSGADRFHPGPDGAWLTALVIVAMLYDRPVDDFPNLRPRSIPPAEEAILRRAAAAAIASAGRR